MRLYPIDKSLGFFTKRKNDVMLEPIIYPFILVKDIWYARWNTYTIKWYRYFFSHEDEMTDIFLAVQSRHEIVYMYDLSLTSMQYVT